MCGIFGYSDTGMKKSRKEMSQCLINGLEKMEYRGYDSAGLCLLDGDKVLSHLRAVGRVSNLESKSNNENSDEENEGKSLIGIAHTRWATHGKSTEENAHPVRSDRNNTFFVVHNGIISNYSDLKAMLVSNGYSFETQTDTEVASKLALYYYDQDESLSFKEIARKVTEKCDGAYAFIFVSPKFPGEMIAVRQKAPIIIGVKNPEASGLQFNKSKNSYEIKCSESSSFVISSDISAIIEHTLDLIYLEDSDLAVINKDGMSISLSAASDMTKVRSIIKANTALDSVLKGNFAHFMLKEIHEQAESVLNTIRNRVDFENKMISLETLEDYKGQLSSATRYIFIACGTSYNSCHATKKIFEELTDQPVCCEIASHFLDLEPKIYSTDIVLFISQSGETFDSLAALNYCKSKGAFTVGITNNRHSTMAKETSCHFDLNAGVEKGVASTKAYTSQFMSIVLIGLFISQTKNMLIQRRHEIIDAISELPGKVRECLSIDVDHFIEALNSKDSMIVVGRGYQAATCLEGSLKIKEISYIHCEGILAGELKHGPLALVTDDKNVMVIIANDDYFQKSHSALEQIQARGAVPFVICTDDIKHKYSKCISVPSTINCLQGLLTVIPFQLLSYKLALKRGFDPDFPRNLAKSVTVE